MLNLNERFSFNDYSIAWGELGQGDPIVLVHGFPWSAQAWRHIAPWLASKESCFFTSTCSAADYRRWHLIKMSQKLLRATCLRP